MIRLPLKKQICMEGGCMLNSGEMVLGILTVLGGLFGMMMSFYMVNCLDTLLNKIELMLLV